MKPRGYPISRGIDEREVQPDRPRKSGGTENTFAIYLVDLDAARTELLPLRHCETTEITRPDGDTEGQVCRLLTDYTQPHTSPLCFGSERHLRKCRLDAD